MTRKVLWASASSIGLTLLLVIPAISQDKKDAPKRETVAKPLTEKQLKKKEAALKKELETPWKKWLNEDVTYIITDEERKAFRQLNTDEEREQFVEQFWLRRDPTPDTVENEYKEEHYRRIAYTNERFASGIPGWKTDRGRIYITFGPPDERDEHPSGGTYERPTAEGGGETTTFPFEDWRYRYIEGIGNDVNIEFVDTTMTGEYHMTMDPSEKDALTYVPGAGLTLSEQMGLSDKTARFNRSDGTHMGASLGATPASYNQFDRLEQFAKLQQAPKVKFKDLEEAISTRITYNVLPMQVVIDYVRVTDASVTALITVQFENKDLQFQTKDGVAKATVNLLGRISTMTRRPVDTFEKPLEIGPIPPEMLSKYQQQRYVYQEAVHLAPSRYRLNIVAKDTVAGNLNNYEVALDVPHFDEDKLASSSLILADTIERLPLKSIGGGMFSIGDTKVRPRIGNKFAKNEKMGIYLQLYNFGPDEKTQKPAGTVEYEITKVGSADKIMEDSEDLGSIANSSASQVTIEKLLPLASLPAGTYTIRVKATDKNRNQTVQQQQNFTVS
ncbi:MAG TPA: GWxTD domain-containing protein [Bryobacteraceae bacterium]|jgi:GWxTD domain-containing protein|nr:GWxTD domain-containing protein [Bryobacteraceae bacterium]